MVSVCRELLAMAILVITSEARPQYHKKRDNHASAWNGGIWPTPTMHTMMNNDDNIRSSGIVFPEAFGGEPSAEIYDRKAQQEDEIITEASVQISTSVRYQDDGTSEKVPVHSSHLLQKMSIQPSYVQEPERRRESQELPYRSLEDTTQNQSVITGNASLISQSLEDKTTENITIHENAGNRAILMKNPYTYESVHVPYYINNASEHKHHDHDPALSTGSDVSKGSNTQGQQNFTEKSGSMQNISLKENVTFTLYGRRIDNLTHFLKEFSETENDPTSPSLHDNSSRHYSGQDSMTNYNNSGNVSYNSSENNADEEQTSLSTEENLRKKERILTAWGVKWKIQWNKGQNTTQSTGSSGGSKIVFPGEMDFNTVVRYMPQVNNGQRPRCADDNTFCETADLYPHDYLKRVLENEVNVSPQFFGNDLVSKSVDVNLRINPNDEVSLCPSVEQIVYPKVAQNKEDKWLFVVNQDSYIQGIRIEKCGKQEACRFAENFPLGFVTSCQQKYIYRKLLALGEDGKPTSDSFRLPSCCSCVVSKAYPSGRMADAGGKPQTPATTRRRKRR